MARSRNIKPGFFTNDVLFEMSFGYRLLFIGLWTLADRDGLIEYRPKRIKAQLFPADEIDVEDGIKSLEKGGFLEVYTAENTTVISIVNWGKHQNPHHKEAPSKLPKPQTSPGQVLGKPEASPRQAQEKPKKSRADSLIPDSLIPEYPPNPPDGGKRVNKRFVPPTIAEVTAYLAEKQITNIDPEAFVAYYASVGWKVKGRPMVCWRSAVTTWLKRDKAQQAKQAPIPEDKWWLKNALSEDPAVLEERRRQRELEKERDRILSEQMAAQFKAVGNG